MTNIQFFLLASWLYVAVFLCLSLFRAVVDALVAVLHAGCCFSGQCWLLIVHMVDTVRGCCVCFFFFFVVFVQGTVDILCFWCEMILELVSVK